MATNLDHPTALPHPNTVTVLEVQRRFRTVDIPARAMGTTVEPDDSVESRFLQSRMNTWIFVEPPFDPPFDPLVSWMAARDVDGDEECYPFSSEIIFTFTQWLAHDCPNRGGREELTCTEPFLELRSD